MRKNNAEQLSYIQLILFIIYIAQIPRSN